MEAGSGQGCTLCTLLSPLSSAAKSATVAEGDSPSILVTIDDELLDIKEFSSLEFNFIVSIPLIAESLHRVSATTIRGTNNTYLPKDPALRLDEALAGRCRLRRIFPGSNILCAVKPLSDSLSVLESKALEVVLFNFRLLFRALLLRRFGRPRPSEASLGGGGRKGGPDLGGGADGGDGS